jgi:hypothetical protein
MHVQASAPDLRIHLDFDFSQDSFSRMMLAFAITHLGDETMLRRRRTMGSFCQCHVSPELR